MDDAYGPLARYYDFDPNGGGFEDDLHLIENFAKAAKGPILELAAGTGRVALHLARLGYPVSALDRSPEMLAVAREKAGDLSSVVLVEGDMRDFHLDARFGLILCAIGSFAHLVTPEEQMSCLRACARHLQPGGRLLLDVRFPDPAYMEEISGKVVFRWRERLPSGEWLSKFSVEKMNAAAQTREITHFYDLEAADGTLRRSVMEYDLRYMFPGEMELLFASAGLHVEAVYGDYEMAPLDDLSERMIYVARSR